MPNFPFAVQDSLQIGTATITATGNAIVLPTGTSVGGTQVATTQEVATGGGPKITNLQITDGSWAVLDDTAVDTAGGYILITGTNFVSGCLVYFNLTPANSVAFVGVTSLRVTVPALAAGTYIVYVINPDGGTAIRVPGLNASASPAWQTASGLPDQYDGVVISLSLVATDATSYTLTSGSLPPGLSLNANTGVITGTVTGVTVDTTYTFTVRATDAQLQDSPRTFTVTITTSDPYFKLTTLLLGGEQGNTVVRDSSVNNFNLTVAGDSRASNFTPYGTAWSVQFDGTGDYLSFGSNSTFSFGTGDFTIEAWVYIAASADFNIFTVGGGAAGSYGLYWVSSSLKFESVRYGDTAGSGRTTGTYSIGQWYHIAASRSGGTARLFINGNIDSGSTYAMGSVTATAAETGRTWQGSALNNGHISNLRVINGTALYTANFTPATTNLTSVANTSLLTCHTNRFLDGSTNNFAITRNGDAAVRSFNPFNITNTGDSGSMYFDGTGDYVTAPFHASEYNFGTGNFTIQAWFYIDIDKTISGANGGMIFDYQFENFQLYYVNSPSYMYCDIRNWGTNISLQSTTQMRQGQWYHAAIIRDGVSSVKMYINGVLESTSTTNPGSINFNTYNLYIGVRYNPSGGALDYYHKGYISNYRITNTAVTAGNLLTDSTAITGTKLSTLQFKQPHNNHGFRDASSNNFLITRNGNASQGTFSPFSSVGWSLNFTSGNGITVPTSIATSLASSGATFTVEAWVYLNSYGSAPTNQEYYNRSIFGIGSTYGSFLIDSTGKLNLYSYDGTPRFTASSSTVALRTWTHVAASVTGGVIKLFIDGTPGGTGTWYGHTGGAATTCIGSTPDTNGGTNRYFDGYIAGFRLSNNARYSISFNKPTSLYTADANTVILTGQLNRLVDESASPQALTNVSASIRAFSPFAPTAVYSPAVHGGSAYFDGTGDYLQLPITALTGQFTIEFWFYRAVTGNNFMFTIGDSLNATGSEIYIGTNGTILNYYTGQAARITATPPDVGSWSYIAATRDSNNVVRLYVNGTQVGGTYTHAATLDTTLRVGAEYYSGAVSGITNGYISNFRVSNTARAISMPTQPLVTDVNTLCLLNFTDAAILDRTGRAVVETVADARTSSVQVKYGNGAMYFDGTGDRALISASPNLTFGTSDFTIEMWIWAAAQGSTSARVMGNGAGGSWGANKWIFTTTTASNPNKYTFQFWNYNSGGADLLVSTSTSNNSTWVHVAITRAGSTFRMFVNGVVEATQTSANSLDGGVSVNLEIGRSGLTGEDWAGYLDDLRITRGYARYTANFTPPTGAHRLK